MGYIVIFSYAVDVEASSPEEAEQKGIDWISHNGMPRHDEMNIDVEEVK